MEHEHVRQARLFIESTRGDPRFDGYKEPALVELSAGFYGIGKFVDALRDDRYEDAKDAFFLMLSSFGDHT